MADYDVQPVDFNPFPGDPDPVPAAKSYAASLGTPTPPSPGVVGSISNFLYGNPQGFDTAASQLARVPSELPAQYGSAVGERYQGAQNLAATGVGNIQAGNYALGVPQTVVGQVGQWASPLTGALGVAGANFDPAIDPGVAPTALPHIAEPSTLSHAITAQDTVPAIFAGVAARRAPLDTLKTAQEMKTAGNSPNDIWEGTGWFQGKDDRWRFEVPDQDARFKQGVMDKVLSNGMHASTLGETLDHPELFRQHPDLANMPVLVSRGMEGGAWHPPTRNNPSGFIETEPDMGTLLHEVQHAVQDREKFTQGASPDDPVVRQMATTVGGKYVDAAEAVLDAHNRSLEQFVRDNWRPELGNAVDLYAKDHPDFAKALHYLRQGASLSPYDMYYRTAGEVEARNVAGRRLFERHWTPWSTEDVSPEQQYLRENYEPYLKQQQGVGVGGQSYESRAVDYDPFAPPRARGGSVTGVSWSRPLADQPEEVKRAICQRFDLPYPE